MYCTGQPTPASPVLVTANYKLSFDALRKELSGESVWILVLDTRGINIWCASGKGTFSNDEIAYQVTRSRLADIVEHRQLILPQLAASGVAAHMLNKACGFSGRFGPIRAADLPEFLRSGTASETMRMVTFTFKERAVLIPVEITLLWKQLIVACLLFCVISGISPKLFSWQQAAAGTRTLFSATVAAIISGAILTPICLPWIPFRRFWLKGLLSGLVTASLFLLFNGDQITALKQFSLFLWITSCSSYLAMNFTGSTPFTSLSGVKKELQTGLPIQILMAATGLLFWTAASFL